MSAPPKEEGRPGKSGPSERLSKLIGSSRSQAGKSIRFCHPEKESAVVGYLINKGFDGLPPRLPAPEAFTSEYRVPWAAALRLRADGKEVCAHNINDQIRAAGTDSELAEEIPQGWELWSSFCDQGLVFNPKAVAQCLDDIERAQHDRMSYEVLQRALDGELTGAETLEQLSSIQDRVSRKGDLPEILDAATLCTTPPPKPQELIHGLLHRGSKLVLGGGSKSFKTWTLMQMAVGVASGRAFLEFGCEKGRVLFVNLEIQDAFFVERLSKIQLARNILIEPGEMDILNLRGYATDAAVLLPKIVEKAKSRNYALIILDPIYKLLGGRDENASKDMAELLNAVERVAVETGAAIAFGSHFAKGNASGKESMDRISGSGVFARDPDSIMTMTKHEEDDCFTVEMTLRNHPPQEPFVVRRQHPLMVVDGALDPAKLKQVAGRGAIHSADDVLALLEEMTTSEWQKACEKDGISKSSFMRRKAELEKSGRIFRSRIDQKWSRKS